MSSSSGQPPIILYHYDASPYAKRIVWYLQLRGIPYQQCMQPPIQPRPDVALLGIQYRRIPLLAVGRDVYLDTRLILQQLESLPALASSRPKLGAAEGTEHRAVERLLSSLINESGAFAWAISIFPPDLPIFKDERFVKDRSDFMGGASSGRKFGAVPAEARAEASANLRGVFALLEDTFLADGRDWLLGSSSSSSDGPSLADIEGVWLLHWLRGIPGTLPKDVLSEQQFPRVHAWIERFDQAVQAAAQKLGPAPTVPGEDAARTIVGAEYVDRGDDSSFGQVAPEEPVAKALGLKKGDRVVVYPLDTGSTHKDSGSLLGLDGDQVVFETRATVEGTPAVRVHAPRLGFRIVREDQASHL